MTPASTFAHNLGYHQRVFFGAVPNDAVMGCSFSSDMETLEDKENTCVPTRNFSTVLLPNTNKQKTNKLIVGGTPGSLQGIIPLNTLGLTCGPTCVTTMAAATLHFLDYAFIPNRKLSSDNANCFLASRLLDRPTMWMYACVS